MRRLFACLWAAFLPMMLLAQGQYEKKEFVTSNGDTLRYRLLRPQDEVQGRKYPLVLFLHGAGERGSDNVAQLTHGGQMFLSPVNREKFPCYVLFPQCPASSFWAYPDYMDSFAPADLPASPQMPAPYTALRQLLDEYLSLPQVDTQRVYVMGLSMGGMATYDLIIRFPELFAAAVPICGTVNPVRLSAVKDVKVSIYHGDADKVVPVEGSRQAYRALKAAGVSVRYKEFVGCGHGSWDPAFNEPDFMSWLFSQKRRK